MNIMLGQAWGIVLFHLLKMYCLIKKNIINY